MNKQPDFSTRADSTPADSSRAASVPPAPDGAADGVDTPVEGRPCADESAAPRRPHWKSILSTALFLALLAALIWYVREHWADMRQLLTLSPGVIALLLGLGLASSVVNCLYHLSILQTYGLRLTLTDWMGVVSVANAISYVLPMRGDLIFTAAYYKRVKGLAYTKSVSMAAGNIVFGVGFSLLEILVALLCMGLLDGFWPPLLWVLLAAGTACMGFFLWLSLHAESALRARLEKHRIVADVLSGFNALLRNRTLLLKLLGCLVSSNLVHLLMYMVCFEAVGLPVTLYEALFYNSVSWLIGIVAIVPGNLGIKEMVMGASAAVMGAMTVHGVAASLLERVAMMVVYIGMGLVFALPVWRRFGLRGEKERRG